MSPTAKVWIELSPFLGIGWVFCLSLGLFTGLGWWLDQKLHTGAKWMIAGSVFGILVGFLNFYKVIKTLDRRKKP